MLDKIYLKQVRWSMLALRPPVITSQPFGRLDDAGEMPALSAIRVVGRRLLQAEQNCPGWSPDCSARPSHSAASAAPWDSSLAVATQSESECSSEDCQVVQAEGRWSCANLWLA